MMFASLLQSEYEGKGEGKDEHNIFFVSAVGRMELSLSDMVKAVGEADLEEKSSALEKTFRCLIDNRSG